MARPKSFLDRVNATEVSAELLGEVMQMTAELPPETRQSYEARMVHLFEFLKEEKGLKGNRHSDVALAVEFRLTAMSRLLGEQAAPGWTLPGQDGAEYVPIHMLRAAAEQPLIETPDQQAGFNADAFRVRVLELSEAKGNS